MSFRDPRWRQAMQDTWLVVRYTRHWLHYGVMTFTVLCSLVAAARGALQP
jgi:hypothetical protein